jgi:hypothetical protein
MFGMNIRETPLKRIVEESNVLKCWCNGFSFFNFVTLKIWQIFPKILAKEVDFTLEKPKSPKKSQMFGKKTITGCCWLHTKTISSVDYLQTNISHICSWCFSFQRMFFVILPNLPDLEEKLYNCQILTTVFPASSQNIKRFLNFLLSY